MLLPNLPPARLEVAGGHMVEDQSREGAPHLGTPQWQLVATMCWHGGTELNPPRWLWCAEYSPSLTERVFWRPNIVCIPILRICFCLWHPLCVTLETKKRKQLEILSFSTEIK